MNSFETWSTNIHNLFLIIVGVILLILVIVFFVYWVTLTFKYLPNIISDFAVYIQETYGGIGIFVFLLVGVVGFLYITIMSILINLDIINALIQKEIIPRFTGGQTGMYLLQTVLGILHAT